MPITPRHLTLSSRIENLPVIIDFITSFMEDNGLGPGIVNRVQVAADEAATNIIKHAYTGREGPVTIDCSIENGALTIVLADQGPPFDPTSVKAPDLDSGVEDRPIGGLGIHLMRQLMDEVVYRHPPEGGNTLTLVKRL